MTRDADFAGEFNRAVQGAMLDIIRKGDWIDPPKWSNRVPIDQSLLRAAMQQVNLARVVESLVIERIEQRIANQIIASMATEIDSDVKKIMSNQELREDLRSVIRAKIREAADALKA